jgi:hypothetical protein
VKLLLTTKQAGTILGITRNGVLCLEKQGLLTDVMQVPGGPVLGRHSHAYEQKAVAQLKKTYIRKASASTNHALAAQAATGNGAGPVPTTAVGTSGDGILTRLGHLDRRVSELAQVVERLDTAIDRLTRLWQ